MTNFTVAFIGLPSSGKSSIINSLLFKRQLQSGVCRTTTDVHIIEEILIDDNNNEFRVIDLPGICDSEESDKKFNDMTYTHIKDANLIYWVSDVNKAFITTHEVNEYNNLKDFIQELQNDTGRIYKYAIMLSKCDKDCRKKSKAKKQKINDEIIDSDEDTDINDLIDKVKEKFPSDDILLFNAYGRSYYHKKTSPILKKFVTKMIGSSPSKINITFDITKYISNYLEHQLESYFKIFLLKYKEYLNYYISFLDLIYFWNNLTIDQKHHHLLMVCDEHDKDNLNYRIFKYIHMAKLIIADDNNNYIYETLLDYYHDILVLNYFTIEKNYHKTYNKEEEFFEEYIQYFLMLNDTEIFDRIYFLLTKSKISTTNVNRLLYTIKTTTNNLTIRNLNYQAHFNKIITDNLDCFDRYYQIVKITHEEYYFVNLDSKNIYEIIYNYMDHLETLSNDDNYIYINKIEIIYHLIHKTKIECHFTKLQLSPENQVSQKRLLGNSRYRSLVVKIWQKIYSNIILDYDLTDYFDFKPVDVMELCYV